MTTEQIAILRHALGLRPDGRGESYRRHFVTSPQTIDHPICMALVDAGHMVKRPGSALTGGDDLFLVTDQGKSAATQRKEAH